MGRNIAPNRLNGFAEGPITRRVRGRVQVSHLFDRDFAGGLPQFNFKGHTLFDAMLQYDADDAGRFTVGVSNLFDKQYVSYYSQTATFVSNRDFVSGRGRAITPRWKSEF